MMIDAHEAMARMSGLGDEYDRAMASVQAAITAAVRNQQPRTQVEVLTSVITYVEQSLRRLGYKLGYGYKYTDTVATLTIIWGGKD